MLLATFAVALLPVLVVSAIQLTGALRSTLLAVAAAAGVSLPLPTIDPPELPPLPAGVPLPETPELPPLPDTDSLPRVEPPPVKVEPAVLPSLEAG